MTNGNIDRAARTIISRDRVFTYLTGRGSLALARWWLGTQDLVLNARLFSFVSAGMLILWGVLAIVAGLWPATGDLPVIAAVENTLFGPLALPYQGLFATWAGIIGVATTPFVRHRAFYAGLFVMAVFWLLPITSMWGAAAVFSLRLPGGMVLACAWAAYRAYSDQRATQAEAYRRQKREYDDLLKKAEDRHSTE